MKKLTALIALLLVTISLSACGSDSEPLKLTNFTIQQVTTVFNDKTQFDSEYNADSTNTTLFSNTKDTIGEFEVTMITDLDKINPNDSQVYLMINTNNGNLEIYKATFPIDGEDTEVTIVEFGENSAAYTDVDLYDDLKDLF